MIVEVPGLRERISTKQPNRVLFEHRRLSNIMDLYCAGSSSCWQDVRFRVNNSEISTHGLNTAITNKANCPGLKEKKSHKKYVIALSMDISKACERLHLSFPDGYMGCMNISSDIIIWLRSLSYDKWPPVLWTSALCQKCLLNLVLFNSYTMFLHVKTSNNIKEGLVDLSAAHDVHYKIWKNCAGL